jgi:hypothetical protein
MERALTTATVRLAWDHAVGNFWVDTGLVVLLRQFGEGEQKGTRRFGNLLGDMVI